MIIAVIADTHGNLPALNAIRDDAARRGAEIFWNLGDSVGYGPFPDEVVTWMRERAAADIVGNYDLKVLRVPNKLEKWKRTKMPEKWLAFLWAYEHLSEESKTYLGELPEQTTKVVLNTKIRLVHGSPDSIKEHLTFATSMLRFRELAKSMTEDIILCGHSHRAFFRGVDGKLFFNPGSVGRPDDGDPRASYGILSIRELGVTEQIYTGAIQRGVFSSSGGESTEYGLFRVEYDVTKIVSAIHENALPEEYAQMFVRGLNIDIIQGKTRGEKST